MTKLFPRVNIRNMDFYRRGFNGCNGIGNGNGSVSISSGIQNNTVITKTNFM